MLGVVVGFRAEAALAKGLGGTVAVAGGDPAGAAERLAAQGVAGLLSFGLAGGLAPRLAPGAVLVPQAVVDGAGGHWPTADLGLGPRAGLLLAAAAPLARAADKRAAAGRTGAAAVDMESAAVARAAARHGLPFAALRAVADPAERDLPQAALLALDPAGRLRIAAMLRSLLGNPAQLAALLSLARDAAAARRALLTRVAEIGPLDGLARD